MMKKEIEMVDVQSVVAREAVARIIDPEAWAYFDSGAGQRYDVDLLRFDQWKQSSLAKADAILALITAAPNGGLSL